MVGRQDSTTSTAASAALPQRRLPPLRRHAKRRAFTPTGEQVPRHYTNTMSSSARFANDQTRACGAEAGPPP